MPRRAAIVIACDHHNLGGSKFARPCRQSKRILTVGIDRRMQKEKLTNVRTVLGEANDPKLPAQSVDVVLMLKVYHEIAHPLVLLARLKPALKPGARIGIIDRNGDGTDHGLNSDVIAVLGQPVRAV